MIKDVEIFIALIFLVFSVILIFNARNLVRLKSDGKFENSKVTVIKVIGVIVGVISLLVIYYINNY